MIRKTHICLAQALGKAACENMYNDFKNHLEYRGSKFEWKYFPRLVFRLSELSLYFHQSVWNRFTKKEIKELKLIQYNTIVATFERLIK
jgi:hypothetical protein